MAPETELHGRRSVPGDVHERQLFHKARLSQISHDLRTPLTVILGYAELLQVGNPRDDQWQALDALARAGAALRIAVEQLIASSADGLGVVIQDELPAPMHASSSCDVEAVVDVTDLRHQQEAIDMSMRFGEPQLLEIVDRQREALTALRTAANTDFLTGIGNRRAIDQRLAMEWGRAKRHHRPLSVLMLDIDGFRAVNNHLGHLAGDIVIASVAQRLASTLRKEDEVARVGGDEFMVVCPETDVASSRAIARKLSRAVAEPALQTPRGPVTVHVSIGSASSSDSLSGPDEVVAAADAALRRAKLAVTLALRSG